MTIFIIIIQISNNVSSTQGNSKTFQVVDPVKDYVDLMKTIVDFGQVGDDADDNDNNADDDDDDDGDHHGDVDC